MAQYTFRMNITASMFPFLRDQIGQTVIVPNQDQFYQRPNAFSGEGADKNLGIPQLVFCENVMPVSYGTQSVGFINSTEQFPGGLLQSDQFIYFRGATGRRYLANFNRANGMVFVYSPEISAWQLITTVPAFTNSSQMYVALVQGRCFFYFKNQTVLWEFKDFNTFSGLFEFVAITTLGITDLSPIFGIVGANNYLILFTRNQIFYAIPDSAVASPIDFTPSLATGAAVETPSVLKGIILTCLPTQDGFYMFTSTNIIAAYYSSNIRFPWTYRELEGSAPIPDLNAIGVDKEQYPHYAYTSAGLLKIGKSSCTPALSEAAEFVGGKVYEYFDWPSKTIKTRNLAAAMHVGLSYIAGRWVVISYGANNEIFTHAIIWDEHLKRWGKIRRNHSRVVEFFGVAATLASTPGVTYQDELTAGWTYQDLLNQGKTYADLGGIDYSGNPDIALEYQSLGFVTEDGVVQVVDFSKQTVNDQSIAIWGRMQFTRNHRTSVLSAWFETLNAGTVTARTKVAIHSTNDGRNIARTNYGYPIVDAAGGVRKYQYSRSEGINHYVQVEGDFDLSTIILTVKQTGHAMV